MEELKILMPRINEITTKLTRRLIDESIPLVNQLYEDTGVKIYPRCALTFTFAPELDLDEITVEVGIRLRKPEREES